MLLDGLVILLALALTGWLAFSKKLRGSDGWRATVAPLASIMGSGFLVCAPLLGGTVGVLSVVCMAALLALAYGVGGAIRFNIRHFEPIEHEHGPAQDLAFVARVVLAGAYFVSISYYLQLLAAFVLDGLGVQDPTAAHALASALLVTIAGVGVWRGLGELELVDRYAVSLNLAVIAALLFALAWHNIALAGAGAWKPPDVDSGVSWHDARVVLGLLIVVQGFEISRYIGDEHPAELRVRTMRRAQLISAAIYVVFLALVTVLFEPGTGADVTAIIRMVGPVAAVLPALLVVAAVGSQFSAAVADASGAGGLIEEITGKRMPVRYTYLLILAVTLALTWQTDVTVIIAYASRAFALFYTLQCAVAAVVAWTQDKPGRVRRAVWFGVLGLFSLAVFALGVPAG